MPPSPLRRLFMPAPKRVFRCEACGAVDPALQPFQACAACGAVCNDRREPFSAEEYDADVRRLTSPYAKILVLSVAALCNICILWFADAVDWASGFVDAVLLIGASLCWLVALLVLRALEARRARRGSRPTQGATMSIPTDQRCV